MNEQTESGEETPQGKAPEETPSTTVKSLYFLIGFLGWFLVNALIYMQKFDQESLMIADGVGSFIEAFLSAIFASTSIRGFTCRIIRSCPDWTLAAEPMGLP